MKTISRNIGGRVHTIMMDEGQPHLSIDGQHVMVERDGPTTFYSHSTFRSYSSLDEMAEHIIRFDPKFQTKAQI